VSDEYVPFARVVDLSPEQLEQILARWMGYAPSKADRHRRPHRATWEIGTRDTPDYASHWPGPPPYASRLDTTAEIEAEIIALGFTQRYGELLYLMTNDRSDPFDEFDDLNGTVLANVATADAPIRCRALLEVLIEAALIAEPEALTCRHCGGKAPTPWQVCGSPKCIERRALRKAEKASKASGAASSKVSR